MIIYHLALSEAPSFSKPARCNPTNFSFQWRHSFLCIAFLALGSVAEAQHLQNAFETAKAF